MARRLWERQVDTSTSRLLRCFAAVSSLAVDSCFSGETVSISITAQMIGTSAHRDAFVMLCQLICTVKTMSEKQKT